MCIRDRCSTSPTAASDQGTGSTGPGGSTSTTATGAPTPRAGQAAYPTGGGPTSTAAAPSDRAACVSAAYDGMSQAQRWGQLFMVGIQPAQAPAGIDAVLRSTNVGSVIYLGGWSGAASVTATSQHLQQVTTGRVDLFIAADQEGGAVQQLKGKGFTVLPAALDQGKRSAGELTALGSTLAQEPVSYTHLDVYKRQPTARPGSPATAYVDLGAIEANVRAVQARAPGSALMVVVKADAYGHGLLPVARAARRAGAGWIGVAQLPEAISLRDNGVDGRVLAWLAVPGADFAGCLERDIDLGVSATWALAEIAAAARHTGRTARVHLKVDSGLGRGGAYAAGFTDRLGAAARATREGTVQVLSLIHI